MAKIYDVKTGPGQPALFTSRDRKKADEFASKLQKEGKTAIVVLNLFGKIPESEEKKPKTKQVKKEEPKKEVHGPKQRHDHPVRPAKEEKIEISRLHKIAAKYDLKGDYEEATFGVNYKVSKPFSKVKRIDISHTYDNKWVLFIIDGSKKISEMSTRETSECVRREEVSTLKEAYALFEDVVREYAESGRKVKPVFNEKFFDDLLSKALRLAVPKDRAYWGCTYNYDLVSGDAGYELEHPNDKNKLSVKIHWNPDNKDLVLVQTAIDGKQAMKSTPVNVEQLTNKFAEIITSFDSYAKKNGQGDRLPSHVEALIADSKDWIVFGYGPSKDMFAWRFTKSKGDRIHCEGKNPGDTVDYSVKDIIEYRRKEDNGWLKVNVAGEPMKFDIIGVGPAAVKRMENVTKKGMNKDKTIFTDRFFSEACLNGMKTALPKDYSKWTFDDGFDGKNGFWYEFRHPNGVNELKVLLSWKSKDAKQITFDPYFDGTPAGKPYEIKTEELGGELAKTIKVYVDFIKLVPSAFGESYDEYGRYRKGTEPSGEEKPKSKPSTKISIGLKKSKKTSKGESNSGKHIKKILSALPKTGDVCINEAVFESIDSSHIYLCAAELDKPLFEVDYPDKVAVSNADLQKFVKTTDTYKATIDMGALRLDSGKGESQTFDMWPYSKTPSINNIMRFLKDSEKAALDPVAFKKAVTRIDKMARHDNIVGLRIKNGDLYLESDDDYYPRAKIDVGDSKGSVITWYPLSYLKEIANAVSNADCVDYIMLKEDNPLIIKAEYDGDTVYHCLAPNQSKKEKEKEGKK